MEQSKASLVSYSIAALLQISNVDTTLSITFAAASDAALNV